jgi:hypothetical protein
VARGGFARTPLLNHAGNNQKYYFLHQRPHALERFWGDTEKPYEEVTLIRIKMKTTIKVFFVFVALFFISNLNEIQAQATLRITNPTCCPGYGNCGADHPVNGPSFPATFSGHGVINVHLGWATTFPSGVFDTYFWAKTMTVATSTPGTKMYCYGEKIEAIGYGFNLVCELTLSTVYILDVYDPD